MSTNFVLPIEATHGKLRTTLERLKRQQAELDEAKRDAMELAHDLRKLERLCREAQDMIDREIAAAEKEMLSTEGMTIQ